MHPTILKAAASEDPGILHSNDSSSMWTKKYLEDYRSKVHQQTSYIPGISRINRYFEREICSIICWSAYFHTHSGSEFKLTYKAS